GDTWEIDTVGPVLAAAVADLNRWSPDTAPAHPIAAMGEPMLALYEKDPNRAFAVFDRYMTSEDPWLRAAVPLLRGTFGSMLGQSDSATWLGLVHAELLYREGDTVSAGRICAGLLAQLEEKQSSWWYGVQAVIQARLALIALADGDEARCRTLLAAALQTATS